MMFYVWTCRVLSVQNFYTPQALSAGTVVPFDSPEFSPRAQIFQDVIYIWHGNLQVPPQKKTWGLKWSSLQTSMLKVQLISKTTILDPTMWPQPFAKSKLQNKIQNLTFHNQILGLKWSSLQTSMLKGAVDLKDFHLRPHHVAISLPKSKPPKNSTIQSSK